MANNNNLRLNGLNPLGYMGVNPYTPVPFIDRPFSPTTTDYKNFVLGTVWLNTTTKQVYMLVSLASQLATWALIGVGSGNIESLTGNSGGAVDPDGLGNVNIVGDGTTIDIVGTPGTNTLTVSQISGAIGAHTFHTDSTDAIESAGAITFTGAGGITTSGSGSTVTITGGGAISESYVTDSGTATPVAHSLNINAGNASLNCGSSVLFSGSGSTVELNVTDLNNNTIIGSGCGNLTLTSTNSTVFGSGSATALSSGSNNVILGHNAGNNITTESNCLLVNAPGVAGVSGLFNINGVYSNYGSGNVFVGGNTGNFTLTTASCKYNSALGSGIFPGITTGDSNTAAGYLCLTALNSGSNNCSYGMESLLNVTTGSHNSAFGYTCGANSVSGGITTGSNNCLFGSGAGSNYRSSESDNIIIGSGMAGIVGESNVTKIGGIRGTTTTNNDAVAVVIDSAGQLGTVSSSARYKDNIKDMASYSNDILNLRPVVFNYKKHDAESISVGLIAEEVEQTAPQLVVYDKHGIPETVKYQDLIPMLLNELQKMDKRIKELE
jgi:hypothetical protein